uniref:Uncharacterized protein n=1 Tax=Salix viminalis TaxID=40686 RepID=A0A6N2L9G4_SALVM
MHDRCFLQLAASTSIECVVCVVALREFVDPAANGSSREKIIGCSFHRHNLSGRNERAVSRKVVRGKNLNFFRQDIATVVATEVPEGMVDEINRRGLV